MGWADRLGRDGLVAQMLQRPPHPAARRGMDDRPGVMGVAQVAPMGQDPVRSFYDSFANASVGGAGTAMLQDYMANLAVAEDPNASLYDRLDAGARVLLGGMDAPAMALGGALTPLGAFGSLGGKGPRSLAQRMLGDGAPGGGVGSTADDLAAGAAKTARRTMTNAPDLRLLSTDDAIAAARLEPHLIQAAEGQYVGAPRGVRSAEDIARLRADFDAQVGRGASGADWYVRGRDFNAEIAGLPVSETHGGAPGIGHNSQGYVRPDAEARAALAAQEEALWSAQASPDTNLNFALQGHNAYEAGVPAELVRTGQQANTYNAARDAGTPVPLGAKTGIYGAHLDPTQPFATTGTNDIWHARALGFQGDDGSQFSRALTAQEHRFMDYETMLAVDRANQQALGGRTDWTAHEIQAAPWVAGKGEGLAASRNLSVEEGVRQASFGYPDFADKFTAHGTYEQVPGASTGLLSDVLGLSQEGKAAFGNQAPWTDALGRDRIYDDMNFWTRPTLEGTGVYRNAAGEMEYNPAYVARPMVPLSDGAMMPRDKAALDAAESVRGYVDFQEGSPWNKVSGQGAGKTGTSLEVNMGRMPTPEEMRSLHGIAEGRGLTLANTDDGAAMLQFDDAVTGRDAAKLLREIKGDVNAVIPDATLQRGRSNSGYVDQAENLALANAGEGRATTLVLSYLDQLRNQAPGMYDKLLSGTGVSDKARMNLQRLIDYGGKGQRPDYEEALRILSESGLKGLIDRVKKYGEVGLPSVLGAVGLPSVGAAVALPGEDTAGAPPSL